MLDYLMAQDVIVVISRPISNYEIELRSEEYSLHTCEGMTLVEALKTAKEFVSD